MQNIEDVTFADVGLNVAENDDTVLPHLVSDLRSIVDQSAAQGVAEGTVTHGLRTWLGQDEVHVILRSVSQPQGSKIVLWDLRVIEDLQHYIGS